MADTVYVALEGPILIRCETLTIPYRIWSNVYRYRNCDVYRKVGPVLPDVWDYRGYVRISSITKDVIQQEYIDRLQWDTTYYVALKFTFYESEAMIGPLALHTDKPSATTLYAHFITQNSVRIYGQITTPSAISFGYRFHLIDTSTGIQTSTPIVSNNSMPAGSREYYTYLTNLKANTVYKYCFEVLGKGGTSHDIKGEWLSFKTGSRTWQFRAFATLPDQTEIFGDWVDFERPL